MNQNHVILFQILRFKISDLHLSLFHDKSRIDDFHYFCEEILNLINPKLVIASGN
jgi:hypothetical protein